MKKMIALVPFLVVLCGGALPVLAAEEDEQYVATEDFFISTEPFKNQDWIGISLAKQLQAPTKETKNEGQFLRTSDGKTLWTKYFWKTTPVAAESLKLGDPVVMADLQDENGLYRAPETRDEAVTSAWFMAKVTDLSDLYKDVVMVSGGYKIRKDALRALVIEKK